MSNTLYFKKPGEITYIQITIKPPCATFSDTRHAVRTTKISFPTQSTFLLKTGPPNLCILGGCLKQILLFYTNIYTNLCSGMNIMQWNNLYFTTGLVWSNIQITIKPPCATFSDTRHAVRTSKISFPTQRHEHYAMK